MKLAQLLLEYQELSAPQIGAIAQASFKSVYPNVKVFTKADEPYVSISTSKQQSMSMWGMGGDDYRLTLNAYIMDDQADVVVGSAWAGDYKGVTAVILKNIFAKLAKINPNATLTLAVEDDRSDGRWEQIAAKLGVQYNNSLW